MSQSGCTPFSNVGIKLYRANRTVKNASCESYRRGIKALAMNNKGLVVFMIDRPTSTSVSYNYILVLTTPSKTSLQRSVVGKKTRVRSGQCKSARHISPGLPCPGDIHDPFQEKWVAIQFPCPVTSMTPSKGSGWQSSFIQ